MITLTLLLVGFAGLIFGTICLVTNIRRAPHGIHRSLFIGLLFLGIVFGFASLCFTNMIGCPAQSGKGETWTIFGVPFFTVVFDSEGRDYVGPFTFPAVIANSIFWTLVPQMILFFMRCPKKKTEQGAAANP
jgi:hypothetical protein